MSFRGACLICAWLFAVPFFVCLAMLALPIGALIAGERRQSFPWSGVEVAIIWAAMSHALLCWLACLHMARRATAKTE